MTTSAPAFDNPLEAAAVQLHDMRDDGDRLPDWFDAGSVGRMLVHITNINRSVIASTQDHRNASKRLSDFAQIFVRLARNSEPSNDAFAVRMTSVANNLRAASEELASADVIPKWRPLGAR